MARVEDIEGVIGKFMERRILITGAAGFVGSHLTQVLLQSGFEVVALDANPKAALPPGVQLIQANLADPASLAGVPRDWWGVVHLAAISVPSLFVTTAPVVANLQMTLNLLEHLQSARTLLVSSCHVYAPSDRPRKETDLIEPQGRYGLSKFLCEQLAQHYGKKLDIRIARPFNHIGAGMPQNLMIPSMIRRILEHPVDDLSPVVMTGNNSIRDFIDVRDVAAGYLAILGLENPKSRIYNVCTGRAVSIREVVETTLRLNGSSRTVEFQSQVVSADDIEYIVGHPGTLNRESGWKASFSLEQSLRSLLPNN